MHPRLRAVWPRLIAGHRILFVGATIIVVLGVGAAVLTLADPGRGARKLSGAVIATTTPTSVSATAIAQGQGVSGRTNRIAAVRTAPGPNTPVLGTLGRDERVEIDGRNATGTWLRIIFPPGSTLRGWIAAEMLATDGNVTSLAVATPDAPLQVAVPTMPRIVPRTTSSPTRVAAVQTGTPTPRATQELPDLIIVGAPRVSPSGLVVTVSNRGVAAAVGTLVVGVFTSDGTRLLGTGRLANADMPPGASVDVDTGYVVKGSQRLLLIVNPDALIVESNQANNSETIAVTAP